MSGLLAKFFFFISHTSPVGGNKYVVEMLCNKLVKTNKNYDTIKFACQAARFLIQKMIQKRFDTRVSLC